MNILLDMDGVLKDFVSAAIRANGYCFSHDDVNQWSLWEIAGATSLEFWANINGDEGFWSSMAEYDWWIELIEMVNAVDPNFSFCTTPSHCPSAASGKLSWLQSHFGPKFGNYVLTPQKHLLARPANLLIDDSDSNVKDFRAAGGNAILFPQPWNANRELVGDRLGYVRQELAKGGAA